VLAWTVFWFGFCFFGNDSGSFLLLGFVLLGLILSLESLILAQDERWRRA
jgi:hypothetical protein